MPAKDGNTLRGNTREFPEKILDDPYRVSGFALLLQASRPFVRSSHEDQLMRLDLQVPYTVPHTELPHTYWDAVRNQKGERLSCVV